MTDTDTVADADAVADATDPEAVAQQRFDEPEMHDLEQDAGNSFERVLDVPITLSMELGRTRMNIRKLLKLSKGSVVRLDRPAGAPLDLLVNGCLIARGEVVVVNERYGVRITDIVSPEERVERLR